MPGPMRSSAPPRRSSSLIVDNGDDDSCSRMEATPTKPSVVKDIIKTLVVLGFMFAVFLLRGNTSLFRFHAPSRLSLLHQLQELQHDLESYEELKKWYVDAEVKLSWEKHQIMESEDVVHSLQNSTIELSKRFYDQEQKLLRQNERAHEELAEFAKDAAAAAQLDHKAMLEISREIEKSYSQVHNKHQQNIALRRQIAETIQEMKRQNMEVPEHILARLNSEHLL
ncbi:hypothetical protein ACHAWX_003252 [Stephanocyclus meneghinianus]